MDQLWQIDALIHRMYRLFSISQSDMEKAEYGEKLKNLINKRELLAGSTVS
ncbi:hypothetical protein [Paenibacillus sp. Y412MC10]|uniref:hypothetical protein n=1 Tax=Geobacillus sp. (strain Y412MC10) TaxID=481743 RepID=UPI0016423D86|nr:hypothetical protein [Paenibacillus sp. Y412MC10]